jgi:hypothetical protein
VSGQREPVRSVTGGGEDAAVVVTYAGMPMASCSSPPSSTLLTYARPTMRSAGARCRNGRPDAHNSLRRRAVAERSARPSRSGLQRMPRNALCALRMSVASRPCSSRSAESWAGIRMLRNRVTPSATRSTRLSVRALPHGPALRMTAIYGRRRCSMRAKPCSRNVARGPPTLRAHRAHAWPLTSAPTSRRRRGGDGQSRVQAWCVRPPSGDPQRWRRWAHIPRARPRRP